MALIRGADFTIEADLGVLPFILDRDHLDGTPPSGTTGAELTPAEDAWTGLECDITSAGWSWGADEPLGPLTECSAGRFRASLFDPERAYDPSNASSPYAGILRVGLPLRVLADGSPAWTGTLEDWDHDLGPAVSTLEGVDALGTVASLILPTLTVPAGTTAAQAVKVLDSAGWPASRRRFEGGSAASRNAIPGVEGSALEALMSVRFAEHAWLWATRDGSIGWRGRDEPYEPAPSVVINCGGAGLGALASRFARARVRNEVLIEGATPSEYSVASITRHGPRTVSTSTEELAFSTALMREAPAPAQHAEAAPRSVTQRITADRSSLLAKTGSTELGGGQDEHLPTGYWNGYNMRGVVGFPSVNWSGVTGVNSAVLSLKTTDFVHVAEGSTPRIYVYRVTAAWSPNSASSSAEGGSGWSTSGLVYPGPAATSSGEVHPAVPEGGNDWLEVDITAIMRAVAPASAGGGGAKWYGLRLNPFEEGATGRNTEFWSAEGPSGNRPSILLTLETNRLPIAPSALAPIGAGASPASFQFRVSDPDADPITGYDLALYQGPTLLWHPITAGSWASGSTVSVPYAGPALTAGVSYTWKVRVRDAAGYGPYNALVSFTTGSAPPPATPYPSWAQVILDQLAEPAILTGLGTITPEGAEVVPIVCAEFGDRWTVVDDMTSPPISRTVRVIGARVSIGPERIEVDAVTEDV